MTDANRPTPDRADAARPGRDTDPTTPLGTTTPLDTTRPLGTTTPLDPAAFDAPPVPAAEPLPRRRPLFPTILWGALMLALAAYVAARELVPGGFDLVTWFLTAVVGIGLLLVLAGIIAASRRAG